VRLTNLLLFSVLLVLSGMVSGCAPSRNRGDDDSGAADDDDDSGSSDDDDDGSGSSGDDDDDSVPLQPPVLFEAGWSFGECGGLCFGDLQLLPGASVLYTLGSWEGTDSWSLSAALSAAGEGELVSLVATVNYSALDPVYGCPDCADGGASTLTWHEIPLSFTTAYEFGNPPTPLVSLDDAVREVMAEAATCSFAYWLVDPGNCVPVP